MGHREPDVLVIGAGVCGLTTAICLAEAGLDVGVLASRPPLETTSAAAGAIWGPHLVQESDPVARWSIATLEILCGLAGQPGTGVRLVRGIQASRRAAEPPGWLDPLPGWRSCGPAELPAGFVTGWRYTAPVLTMPDYLGYLQDRLTAAGGEVQLATVGSLAEAEAPVLVNCTGIGARDLVPDPGLRPVRGQAVLVANPGLTEFFIGPAETGPDFVYMFPHGDLALLGGTEQDGAWDLDPDPEITERIVARCAAVEPRLAGTEILGHRVGLRPVRARVRLDTERPEPGRLLVHNYGHGGSGVTLAWGCARDVARLVLAGPRAGAAR